MSKERDWVDYVNLASNLTQNVQLGGIKDRLSDLQASAASQAREARLTRHALREAEQKAEQVANYREVVVQGERALAGLRHHLPDKPLPVLALALGYKHRYKQNGLGTQCFETFQDKDRVVKLLSGLDDVIDTSSDRLSAGDRDDAQRCFRYQLEEADLKELVAIQKRRDEEVADLRKHALELKPQIADLQRQINNLDKELQMEFQSNRAVTETPSWKLRQKFAGFLAILATLSGLALSGFVMFIIFKSAVSDVPNLDSMQTGEAGIIISLLLTIALGIHAWVVWPRSGPRKAQIREERDALQKRLTPLTVAVSREPWPPSDDERALYGKFGGGVETGSSEYEKMLAERRTLVAEIVSGRRDEQKCCLIANARELQRTLSQHGIESSLGDIVPRRAYTRYNLLLSCEHDISPKLEKALAAALGAADVRVMTARGCNRCLEIDVVNAHFVLTETSFRDKPLDTVAALTNDEKQTLARAEGGRTNRLRLWRAPVVQLGDTKECNALLEFRPLGGWWNWVLIDWPGEQAAMATGRAKTKNVAAHQASLIAQELGVKVLTARLSKHGADWQADLDCGPLQPGEVMPVLAEKHGTPDWQNQFGKRSDSDVEDDGLRMVLKPQDFASEVHADNAELKRSLLSNARWFQRALSMKGVQTALTEINFTRTLTRYNFNMSPDMGFETILALRSYLADFLAITKVDVVKLPEAASFAVTVAGLANESSTLPLPPGAAEDKDFDDDWDERSKGQIERI